MNKEELKVSYCGEWKAYPEFSNKEISTEDSKKVTKKLARHFKLEINQIVFNSRVDKSGRAYKYWKQISYSKKNCWLTVCHEVNHFLCWKDNHRKYIRTRIRQKQIRHGTIKWNRNLQKIMRYCEKKNFWGLRNVME